MNTVMNTNMSQSSGSQPSQRGQVLKSNQSQFRPQVQDVQAVTNNGMPMFQNPMIQTFDPHHQPMQPHYAEQQPAHDYAPVQQPTSGLSVPLQPPAQNTRLKVDITSSYGERRNLNSGGGVSVHTPMSQVSGYSQHLAPQNSRFQQQPPPPISGHAPPTQTSGNGVLSPSNAGNGGHNPNSSNTYNYPAGAEKDRKVTGKSSIRTLIKTAAMRDT